MRRAPRWWGGPVLLSLVLGMLVAPNAGAGERSVSPERLWTAAVMTDPSGRVYVMPRALEVDPAGRRVYLLMSARDWDQAGEVPILVAFDAATGRELWRWREPGLRINDLVAGPDGTRLYLTGSERFGGVWRTLALRASDGRVLWSESLDPPGAHVAWQVAVSPDDASVYVLGGMHATGSGQGRALFVAYRAGDGARRWRSRIGDGYYSFGGSDLVVAPGGSRIGFGAEYERAKGDACRPAVGALRASDGHLVWLQVEATRTPGSCYGPSIANAEGTFLESLAVGSSGHQLAVRALSRRDGVKLWSRRIDDFAWAGGPTVAGGRVAYAGQPFGMGACTAQERSRLLMLSERTGRTLWSRGYGCASPTQPIFSPDGRRLYVAGSKDVDGLAVGYLMAVRSGDGARVWDTTLTGSLPATGLDFLRTGSGGHRLFVAGLTWDSPSGEEAIDNGTVIAGYRV